MRGLLSAKAANAWAIVALSGLACSGLCCVGALYWANQRVAIPFAVDARRALVGRTYLQGDRLNGVASGVLYDLMARARSFEAIGGVRQSVSHVRSGEADSALRVTFVSPELSAYLPLLAGTNFSRGDMGALISPRMAEELGWGREALGKQLEVAGKGYRVTGLLREGFSMPEFRPSGLVLEMQSNLASRGGGSGVMIAFPKEGVPEGTAKAELQALMAQIRLEHVEDSSSRLHLWTAQEFAQNAGGMPLSLALGLVAIVGLAAWLNLGVLVSLAWQRESVAAAIRQWLGATTWQAWRGFVTKKGFQLLAGAAAGVAGGWAALEWLSVNAPWSLRWPGAESYFPVAAAVALGFALLGWAWSLWGVRANGKRTSGGGLVYAALSLLIALSVTAVLGFVPFDRRIRQLSSSEAGLQKANLFIATLTRVRGERELRDVWRDWEELRANVLSDRRVDCVAMSSTAPLTSENFPYDLREVGSESARASVTGRHVSANYRRCAGIALLRGNDFPEGTYPVNGKTPVLLSKSAAERMFPGQEAVGRELKSAYRSRGVMQVVGVVGDSQQFGLKDEQPLTMFLPGNFVEPEAMLVRMRSIVARAEMARTLRRAMPEAIRANYAQDLVDWEGLQWRQLAKERFHQRLCAIAATAFLIVSFLGLAGGLAAEVRGRMRELAIRVVVGASPASLWARLGRLYGVAVVAGIALGLMIGTAIEAVLGSLVGGLDLRWGLEHLVGMAAVGFALALGVAVGGMRLLRLSPSEVLKGD